MTDFYYKVGQLDDRLTNIENSIIDGFKGRFTQSEIDALDTSSYEKGDWLINKDIPTIQLWDGTQWV